MTTYTMPTYTHTESSDTSIKNRESYLENMRKSLFDKAFFIDKLFENVDTIVDFGCADGSLIGFLSESFPNYKYIGYDNDENMLNIARRNYKSGNFFSNLHFDITNNSVLNLSSVIHEIYSYCSVSEMHAFWEYVFGSGFKYIVIRDMMIDESERYSNNFVCIDKVPHKYMQKIREYQDVWGNIETNADFIHFLLKSQFAFGDNWERELHEDYLPIDIQDIVGFVPDGYEISYLIHYTLPYLKHWVNQEMGINLNVSTHLQMIIKRC